jgi:hypothetical protein
MHRVVFVLPLHRPIIFRWLQCHCDSFVDLCSSFNLIENQCLSMSRIIDLFWARCDSSRWQVGFTCWRASQSLLTSRQKHISACCQRLFLFSQGLYRRFRLADHRASSGEQFNNQDTRFSYQIHQLNSEISFLMRKAMELRAELRIGKSCPCSNTNLNISN